MRRIKKPQDKKKSHTTSRKKPLISSNCIGPTIPVGREIQYLPYAGLLDATLKWHSLDIVLSLTKQQLANQEPVLLAVDRR